MNEYFLAWKIRSSNFRTFFPRSLLTFSSNPFLLSLTREVVTRVTLFDYLSDRWETTRGVESESTICPTLYRGHLVQSDWGAERAWRLERGARRAEGWIGTRDQGGVESPEKEMRHKWNRGGSISESGDTLRGQFVCVRCEIAEEKGRAGGNRSARGSLGIEWRGIRDDVIRKIDILIERNQCE